jgi:cleavage and polyadenylation specificity factor subunit 3
LRSVTTHSHSHPHAEHASEDTKLVDDEAAPKTASEDIPSRIDRLIAFLHSHFGNVELLTREEAEASAAAHEKARNAKQTRESTEPALTTDDLKPTDDVKKEALNEETTLKDAAAEIDPCIATDDLDPPQEPKRLTSAPVLRVRLDDDIADLDVDDLVRRTFACIAGVRQLI